MLDNLNLNKYIGYTIQKAKKELLNYTDNIHIVPHGSFVTMDYVHDRIRIWYDPDNNFVSRVTIG